MSKDVEIEVKVIAFTSKAILVDHGGKCHAWIAKSQITDYTGDDEDHATSIFISEWLASDKGIS